MSDTHELPIHPVWVKQQSERRSGNQDADFFYDEIAQRLMEKLDPIVINVQHLVDMGCHEGQRYETLRQKFPQARYTGVDISSRALEKARKRCRPASLIARWLKKTPVTFLEHDMAKTDIAPESVDMIWSNLSLFWHPSPERVFAEWRRILRPEGLCLFTTLGPGNFLQLRQAVADAQLSSRLMPYTDMHDLGDMLVNAGFSDPVMEQEVITLQYKKPETLLKDVYALGGNASKGQSPGLKGRGFYQKLCQALEAQRKPDGYLHLDLEVVYGHAWRANMVQRGPSEVGISLQSIQKRMF
ncbi:methyltransferase domain-containing protein [Basilea psittacipulmonis]|uniref:Methyltransferase type 11 domain-containing protein n=1 Tax=Basilea psittacipulmonis DSM 24701 TaxID=1072685 RepID=A0A077DBQ5_9BURK|nr:methyltransferase domain-containing protein [Basilea psittacipulmonis]AIL32094.1 hypothetical protein IX83_01035 [Basilea psittacipulmonis DSM 24701]